jgi:hypothetical protein
MNAPCRAFLLVAWFLALCCCPALAQWRITATENYITKTTDPVASVAAKELSGGVIATLQVECLVNRAVGGWLTTVILSTKLAPGGAPLTFRIDDRPRERSIMPVSTRHDSIPIHGLDAGELRSAKRLRLEVTPVGSPTLVYEFDVTGADHALQGVPCIKTPDR